MGPLACPLSRALIYLPETSQPPEATLTGDQGEDGATISPKKPANTWRCSIYPWV